MRCKALLDWYSDKQHALFLKNSLLESSPQKTRSPIFPCQCSHASSSQVQLHLDNRFLGNPNSPLNRTKRIPLDLLHIFTANLTSKTRSLDHSNVLLPPFSAFLQWFHSRQAISCFVCPKFNLQMLCAHLFLDRCAVPYWQIIKRSRECMAGRRLPNKFERLKHSFRRNCSARQALISVSSNYAVLDRDYRLLLLNEF